MSQIATLKNAIYSGFIVDLPRYKHSGSFHSYVNCLPEGNISLHAIKLWFRPWTSQPGHQIDDPRISVMLKKPIPNVNKKRIQRWNSLECSNDFLRIAKLLNFQLCKLV